MAKESGSRSPIYQRRIALGITQQAAADQMGVHRVTVAHLESYRLIPGKELRKKVASFLGWSEVEVFAFYQTFEIQREGSRP